MAFEIRVTVEGEGRGKQETVQRVYRALQAAGLPMETPQPTPSAPRGLRVIRGGGGQKSET